MTVNRVCTIAVIAWYFHVESMSMSLQLNTIIFQIRKKPICITLTIYRSIVSIELSMCLRVFVRLCSELSSSLVVTLHF